MKNCNKPDCKQTNPQPLSEFLCVGKDKSKYGSVCKRCRTLRKRNAYIKRAESQKLYNKKSRKINFIRDKGYRLKASYGITLEQYNLMLKTQNHACAVCLQPETKVDTRNGKIRDL